MERKHVVELQAPLFEPHLSRVASEVADELSLSEVKLNELLGRGVGPLTKPIDKPVADRVADIIRAAGADVAVVAESSPAPTAARPGSGSSPDDFSAPLSGAEETEIGAVPFPDSAPPKRNPWLVPVVFVVIVILAVAVYGLVLR